MTVRVVGTCGACGGRVTVPAIWHGVAPPVPTCQSCQRQVQEGPVLPMKDPPAFERRCRRCGRTRDNHNVRHRFVGELVSRREERT